MVEMDKKTTMLIRKRESGRSRFVGFRNKKDVGMSLTPWVLFYFFIAVYLFVLLFTHSVHITTKYVVEDALAAAALAGEVADIEVFSQYQELIITDLDYSKEVFEESLQASLNLTKQGYPSGQSVYFDDRSPVQIVELTLYNVCQGQVYKTDLLTETGILTFSEDDGLTGDLRCESQGELRTDAGQYTCHVAMLNGQEKAIKNTSLYAKIQFGVRGYDGNVVMAEKDILTDIQQNESVLELMAGDD